MRIDDAYWRIVRPLLSRLRFFPISLLARPSMLWDRVSAGKREASKKSSQPSAQRADA
jgi:hypothetical protein